MYQKPLHKHTNRRFGLMTTTTTILGSVAYAKLLGSIIYMSPTRPPTTGGVAAAMRPVWNGPRTRWLEMSSMVIAFACVCVCAFVVYTVYAHGGYGVCLYACIIAIYQRATRVKPTVIPTLHNASLPCTGYSPTFTKMSPDADILWSHRTYDIASNEDVESANHKIFCG